MATTPEQVFSHTYGTGDGSFTVTVILDPEGVTLDWTAEGARVTTYAGHPEFYVPAAQDNGFEDQLKVAQDFQRELAVLGVTLTKELLRKKLKVSSGAALKVLQTLRAQPGPGTES